MDVSVAVFPILAVIASITPSSSAVQCYVCSWSPKDTNNRTDFCTTKNFEPRVAHIDACEYGCEVFVQWDKNDELEQWRRNCVQADTKITGTCVHDEDRLRRWRHCTCDNSLCNSALSWTGSAPLATMLLIAASRFVL